MNCGKNVFAISALKYSQLISGSFSKVRTLDSLIETKTHRVDFNATYVRLLLVCYEYYVKI